MNPKDIQSYNSYIDQISGIFYNAIKNDTLMWEKEWSASDIKINLAHNPVTKTQYKGLNALMLEIIKDEKSYNSSSWLTFNQIKELGGYIQKGSKSVPIGFFTKHKLVKEKDEKGQETEKLEELKYPIFKKYAVFNLDQVKGVEKEKLENLLSDKSYIMNDNFIDIKQCEAILKTSGIEIIHSKGSNEAYYSPLDDKIHLPTKEQFVNEEAYYSTAFHELGHATGHESRLDRKSSSNKDEYAKEELRAEIYSYLQAKDLGIGYNLQNHQSYVKSWLKILDNDKHEIVNAVRDSLKIMKYVKSNWIDQVIDHSKQLSKNKTLEQTQEIKNKEVPQKEEFKNFAKIPMPKLIESLGFEIKKAKSTVRHIVMKDGADTIIISRGKGYEKNGKTLGEGNYLYFNTQNSSDKGTIYNFCKNRNIDVNKLVQGAKIKDYSHDIIISDSKYYDPQVVDKYNKLEKYNSSAAKSLSKIRKINPKILNEFDSIKVDGYKNVIFPSYTLEESTIKNDLNTKEQIVVSNITLSGMNKKLIEKAFTHDKKGNAYDKPLNSLEEGKAGLSILIANNVKQKDITQVVTGENSIDNLSYVELKKIDLSKTALVSFNGSMKSEAIKCFKHLVDNKLPALTNIISAFDNDKQGIEYDQKLNILLKDKPQIKIKIDKSNEKDWNDQLKIYKKEIGKTFANARSYEKSFTLELEK